MKLFKRMLRVITVIIVVCSVVFVNATEFYGVRADEIVLDTDDLAGLVVDPDIGVDDSNELTIADEISPEEESISTDNSEIAELTEKNALSDKDDQDKKTNIEFEDTLIEENIENQNTDNQADLGSSAATGSTEVSEIQENDYHEESRAQTGNGLEEETLTPLEGEGLVAENNNPIDEKLEESEDCIEDESFGDNGVYFEGENQNSDDVEKEPLEDPGFLITSLGGSTVIETSDGMYDGVQIKNLQQTVYIGRFQFLSDIENMELCFNVADDERVKIYIDGNPIKNGDILNFTSSETTITAVVDGNVSVEYNLTIGTKLDCYYANQQYDFSFDPEEDDVIFGSYSILVGNKYYKPLTGVKASLKNAENVRIAADSEITEDVPITLEPNGGEKCIELIPIGSGNVSGELIISADNAEDIVIKLTGNAKWTSDAARVKQLVKYVVYSFIVDDDTDETCSYKINGQLPEGMNFDPERKEIYGVPLNEGRYDFTVLKENREGKQTQISYTFLVSVNSDYLVFGEMSRDEDFWGFHKDWDQWEQIGKHTGALKEEVQNVTFISDGLFNYYVKVWLNGNVLIEGTDYTAESGSTRITLLTQALQNKCKTITREQLENRTYGIEHANTLCVEFNIHPSKSIRGEAYLRKTCENFYVIRDVEEPIVKPQPSDYRTTIAVTVSDGLGNAMTGYALELHSRVQNAMTDASGHAQFSDVEMGDHTLYVKRSDGSVAAERHFTLVPGERTSYDGDIITVANGDIVNLTMTVENEKLSPTDTNTSIGTKKAEIVKTSDDNNSLLYYLLIGVSVMAFLFIRKRSEV